MKIGNWNIKLFKEKVLKKDFEIGSTGTSIYEGIITDEDYNTDLTGDKAIENYEKMRKSDGVVGAILLACELPIRAAHFYVEPASDEQRDKDIAEYVEYNLLRGMTLTWDDFLRQALLMLPFGYMVFEKVFTSMVYKGQNLIGWKKFAPRLPNTIYKWETEDHKDGIQQMLSTGKTPSIPIEKLLIFTYRKEGDNWLGTSILRTAYRSWFFKQHIEKINAIAIERQGIGIPEVELPESYSDADKKKAEEIAKNMRANEKSYVLKPFGWNIGFMDMKGSTVKDPKETIARYNREIMMSVLAHFMDLGSGSTGSRALSIDQSTIFHNNLKAVANQITDIINNYAIRQLVDMNWDSVKDYPTLKYTRIGNFDISSFAVAMQQLSMAGMITADTELESYIRENLELPEKSEEDEEAPESPKPKEKEKEEVAQEFQEWIPRRPLTFAENKVNWKNIHSKLTSEERELGVSLRKILAKIGDDLIKQIQRILVIPSNSEKRNKILGLSIGFQSEYRQEIYRRLRELFQYGKMAASHEMHKEVPVTPAKDISNLSNKADTLTEVMNNDLIKEGKLALLSALEGKKSMFELPIPAILAVVSKAIKDKIKSLGEHTPSIVVSGAINQGRRIAFEVYDKDIYALQRSELLDEKTCAFCEAMDGRVLKKTDPMTNEDGFHFDCRGLWVEIMQEEFMKPDITGISDSLRDSYHGI